MKTNLITGGAGFIGSHLCDYLIEKGQRVIAVDNLISGNRKNIEHLLKNKNFCFIEHDVCKPLKIEKKIDFIYNLASPASPADFEDYAIEIMMANSLGTKNVLDLAVEKKATILEASTSEVYGDPLKHPQAENYFGNVNCFGPRACYDESKRFSEALVYSYQKKFKLNAKIVRLFNTYGSRMRKDDGRVIPNFIIQSLNNKPLTIYGKGQQTRSLCYVSDIVDGLYRLINSKYNKPLNLGNPNEITMLELAKKIKSITKSKSDIEFKKMPMDDPLRRNPNIKLAKKVLGWKPKISLDKGLKQTIGWFSKNY
ncbi:MAG: epimerase [Candidatus Diapherotrites archaeon CG08_land_8_20_14_0_20_34_12]|nr:MAG: epimerase [Candidatus Diapherotrites archaeon CG08_land_8_20_14_0_20_34_12]